MSEQFKRDHQSMMMDTILNNLEEGLILFDQEGLCTFSSPSGEKHFSKKIGESNINYKTLFQDEQINQDDIQRWITLLFSGNFDFFEICTLGPAWVQTNSDKKIEIKYKPLFDAKKKLENVLVVTKDVTAEFEAIQDAENQKSMSKTIIEICNSPKLFQDMLESVNHLNSNILQLHQKIETSWSTEDDEALKRLIHTIKGATSIFNLRKLIDTIHNYEDKLNTLDSLPEKAKFISEFHHYIESTHQKIDSKYGPILQKLIGNQNSNLAESQKKKVTFLAELESLNQPWLTHSFKEKFILTEFKELFQIFDSAVKNLSHTLNKKVAPIEIQSDSILVVSENYADFSASLVHIFSNICDHAIEEPKVRLLKKKNEFGQIRVTCLKTNDQFIQMNISDDGAGISRERIINKIKGTPLESKYIDSADLLNCIFEPSFSTQDTVSEVSGRGVGLNAVMSELNKIGGQVRVISEENKGTTFQFILPILDKLQTNVYIKAA
jgi:two-component system, chemotaxis family, sensor kinase CheA